MKYRSKCEEGFSLLELMVGIGLTGLISIGTMQLMKNTTGVQKKMMFTDVANQVSFAYKLELDRSNESCMDNAEVVSGAAAPSSPTVANSITYAQNTGCPSTENCDSLSYCRENGILTNQLYSSRSSSTGLSNTFANTEQGQQRTIFGQNSGAAVAITEVRMVLPEFSGANIEDRVGSICFLAQAVNQNTGDPLSANSAIAGGSARKWYSFPLNFSGRVDSSGSNSLTGCVQENSVNTGEFCDSLNGTEINNPSIKCANINIVTSNNYDDFENNIVDGSGNIQDYSKLQQGAAINAFGNMGVSESLHVCGNISLGNRAINVTNMTGCNSSGSLYAKNAYADELQTPTLAVAESLSIITSGSLSLISSGAANGKSGLLVKDVKSKVINASFVDVGTDINATNVLTKTLNSDSTISATNVAAIDNIYPINPDKIIKSDKRVKGYGHDSYPIVPNVGPPQADYFATESWASSQIFTKMSDEKMNDFLNTLFQKMNDGICKNNSNPCTDPVQKDDLALEILLNAYNFSHANESKPGENTNYASAANSCPQGQIMTRVDFGDSGNWKGLRYYCRSFSGSDDIYLARVTGTELTKFHRRKTSFTKSCNDASELMPGEFCRDEVTLCNAGSKKAIEYASTVMSSAPNGVNFLKTESLFAGIAFYVNNRGAPRPIQIKTGPDDGTSDANLRANIVCMSRGTGSPSSTCNIGGVSNEPYEIDGIGPVHGDYNDCPSTQHSFSSSNFNKTKKLITPIFNYFIDYANAASQTESNLNIIFQRVK